MNQNNIGKKGCKNIMAKEYRLITFCCSHCGSLVRVLINKNKLTFEIIGKLHSDKEVLTESGYYKCIECHKESNIRFEYIYS